MTKQIIFGSPEAKAIAAADRARAAALEEIEQDFGSTSELLEQLARVNKSIREGVAVARSIKADGLAPGRSFALDFSENWQQRKQLRKLARVAGLRSNPLDPAPPPAL